MAHRIRVLIQVIFVRQNCNDPDGLTATLKTGFNVFSFHIFLDSQVRAVNYCTVLLPYNKNWLTSGPLCVEFMVLSSFCGNTITFQNYASQVNWTNCPLA